MKFIIFCLLTIASVQANAWIDWVHSYPNLDALRAANPGKTGLAILNHGDEYDPVDFKGGYNYANAVTSAAVWTHGYSSCFLGEIKDLQLTPEVPEVIRQMPPYYQQEILEILPSADQQSFQLAVTTTKTYFILDQLAPEPFNVEKKVYGIVVKKCQ